ncbi:MAG: hypothetical protein ABMB14_09095 [Myxococcota bacterium]
MIGVMTALIGCGSDGTTVGATLDDGQVLVGAITTDTLRLEGALGGIDVPLADVGMVLPVERRTLADSNGNVTVWLRNGSELNGKWTEPELAMAIGVGGRTQTVELPTDRLQTLQLQVGESWPALDLFRVRTIWGDDFLVDPEQTRLTLASDLGRFELTLAECVIVGPVGDPTGPWRVVLGTGTVLVGEVDGEALAFSLPMGPASLSVPLSGLVSLARGGWADQGAPVDEPARSPAPPIAMAEAAGNGGHAADALALVPSTSPAPAPARPGLAASAGWFDNRRMSDAKR